MGSKDEMDVQVLLHQTPKVLGKVIRDLGTVRDLDAVRSIMRNYPAEWTPQLPGPLFLAVIGKVESLNKTVIIWNSEYIAHLSRVFLDFP